MSRITKAIRASLLPGLLLMTMSAPSLTAAEPPSGQGVLLTDFHAKGIDFGWFVVNDNVMGGRSEGDFKSEQDGLFFSGHTNTNGGGFSSIRTMPVDLDLSDYAGVQLRLRGDGRRYTWRLTTDARWRGRPISYWAEFETRENEWHTVNIPFSGFIPQFRGYQLDGPRLDTTRITGMGLMIYDKLDGEFELQVASVSAYQE